jgi:hypothetical protein
MAIPRKVGFSGPVCGIQDRRLFTMTNVRLSLAFVAISIAPTPASALAQEYRFQASITVAFAAASNTGKVGFCGGPTGPSA